MRVLSVRYSNTKGQTVLETSFVFSGMIFMTFAVMNLAIVFHTKMIATYAAFMAGRSFQVLGDQTGTAFFKESLDENGSNPQEFLAEMKNAKNMGFIRVAEDIYTCALPWMRVPKEDELNPIQIKNPEEGPTAQERCLSGNRKYEKLNIGEMSFKPWNEEQERAVDSGDSSGLIPVKGGFAEERQLDPSGQDEVLGANARDPLRYGILELPFRTPVLFGFGLTDSRDQPIFQSRVTVPVLLNPGLQIKLEKGDNEQDSFKDSGETSAGVGND